MQNIFYQHLDLGFDVDTTVLDVLLNQIPDLNVGFYRVQPPKFYDTTLINFLDTLGLKIIRFDAVRVPAKKLGGVGDGVPIHYDGHWGNRKESKLAWAFGEDLGDVCWYEAKDPSKPTIETRVTDNNSGGNRFQSFKLEDCTLLQRTKISNPTLINVDILHSVDNPSEHPHWYLTYSLGYKDTDKYASWEETYEIFKPYFK